MFTWTISQHASTSTGCDIHGRGTIAFVLKVGTAWKHASTPNDFPVLEARIQRRCASIGRLTVARRPGDTRAKRKKGVYTNYSFD